MLKFLVITIVILTTYGCAHQERQKHNKFLSNVETQKKVLSPERYQAYLKKMISQKEAELSSINSRLSYNADQYRAAESNSNVMDAHGNSNYNSLTRYSLVNKNLKDEKKFIERELFFLRSQLKVLIKDGAP